MLLQCILIINSVCLIRITIYYTFGDYRLGMVENKVMSIDSDGMFPDMEIQKAHDEGRFEDMHKMIDENMPRAEAELAGWQEASKRHENSYKEPSPKQRSAISRFFSRLFS